MMQELGAVRMGSVHGSMASSMSSAMMKSAISGCSTICMRKSAVRLFASIRMRTGSLACVEFYGVPEPGSGELAWLLDPDLYTDR